MSRFTAILFVVYYPHTFLVCTQMKKAFFYLHIAVFLAGFTGPAGKAY